MKLITAIVNKEDSKNVYLLVNIRPFPFKVTFPS